MKESQGSCEITGSSDQYDVMKECYFWQKTRFINAKDIFNNSKKDFSIFEWQHFQHSQSKSINDCNWTRTHNHLVHKRTLSHLAKLV